jgi:6-phosphofructokinase
MRIGILTGGGDAPGLNGIIESATKFLINSDIEVVGIRDGFAGVYDKDTFDLNTRTVDEIHEFAGTILGTSNRRGIDDTEEFIHQFKALKLDGLIVAGGDGTFRGLGPVMKDIPIIGVPKTIDNDLPGTNMTFGHDTAVTVVREALDSLRHSANAHRRIMVVEAMGRTAGWITLHAGVASMCDAILIPERGVDLKDLSEFIQAKMGEGQRGFVLCVSEGIKINNEEFVKQVVSDAPETKRLGGVSEYLAKLIQQTTGVEARNVILGHLQRSHAPTTFDRLLTTRLGAKAASLVLSEDWGKGVSYKNGQILEVPISDFCGDPRLVDSENEFVGLAQQMGIFI